jgi:hypothetical protein
MTITQPVDFICYFDVFNHPLTLEELVRFSGQNEAVVRANLKPFLAKGQLFNSKGFYSLQENIEQLIVDRKEKEKRALRYLKKMPFFLKRMRNFPFVRAIGISGSLSKNVMHDDGDIDYFIVTRKGRLWICRSFLIAFKKIFLLNSRKYFCVNYFVDEENLSIPDHNFFTATEIAHLLPVLNFEGIESFKSANLWTNEHVSEFEHPLVQADLKNKYRWGAFYEWLLSNQMGDRLDLYLMKLTYKRWQKKFPDFDASKFELTMRTNRGVSKHHPRNFQEKVLKEYEERKAALEK